MSTHTNPSCDRADLLREYAFDELAPAERGALERHLAQCDECSLELDRVRLTVAALRVIPDREVPRRIAFVGDPPHVAAFTGSWLRSFWNSGARLGFASACVLAVAIVAFAWHRPAEVSTAAGTAPVSADVSRQVNEAVSRAVAQVRTEVQAEVQQEDARTLQAALAVADRKHEQEQRALMVAVDENMTVLQKRLNTYSISMLASADTGRPADGQ